MLKGEVDINPSGLLLCSPRAGLRRYTYRLLQRPSRLQRRSGALSVWVVKYLEQIAGTSSVVTLSINLQKNSWAVNGL